MADSEIKAFPFDKNKFDQIKDYKFGKDWPVVYIIENGKEVYVGETINAYSRSKQHYEKSPERRALKTIHLISDDEYNKSATLDIESQLIEYMAGDGTMLLQNGNGGLRNHNYYDKEKYKAKFQIIWEKLQKISLVKKDLVQIKNSDLFKYSPYKSLTEDQILVAKDIYRSIKLDKEKSYIIKGKPGTGKTILAIYLVKFLKEQKETKDLNVAIVLPMTSLRKTIKKVFSKVKGLNASMVIGPNDVTKQQYDVLIVDEAHRLKRRKNITNYKSFDDTNKLLGFNADGDELDWILKSSRHQIFFYDKNQSVRPSDIRHEKFMELNALHYDLMSQKRIDAGSEYTNFIDDLFDLQDVSKYKFPKYDFEIYDDIHKMVVDIKDKDSEFGLSRLVAGYAWSWKTRDVKAGDEDINIEGNDMKWVGTTEEFVKSKDDSFDIEIDGIKLVWNSTTQDWVNSLNAINEVGCIHTVQGYDLNYVGVIIGPELSYDDVNNKLIIDPKKYMDINGGRGIESPEELKLYIINIYKTLLTRGIHGTYLYVVDKKLAKYFKDNINLK